MRTGMSRQTRAPEALLAAVQLSDSALPIGRFVHSHGLEAWLRDHSAASDAALAELVEAAVCEGIAPLDGATVAHAHRAESVEQLAFLDQRLTARKLSPAARNAAQACGRKLSALAPRLATDDVLIGQFAAVVARRDTDGNLAVVEGTLARAMGLSMLDAVLIELRSSAASLLSAAVRLGAMSPTTGQTILAELSATLTTAAELATTLGPDELRSSAPELELYALAHRRTEGRLFST
jgi:urease accessory protein